MSKKSRRNGRPPRSSYVVHGPPAPGHVFPTRTKVSALMRRRVRLAQEMWGSWCWLCGGPLVAAEDLPDVVPSPTPGWWPTEDHVIPRGRGGPNTVENKRPTHWLCNNEKGMSNRKLVVPPGFPPAAAGPWHPSQGGRLMPSEEFVPLIPKKPPPHLENHPAVPRYGL